MFLIIKTSGRDMKGSPITPLREGLFVIEFKYLAYLSLSRITVVRQPRNRIGFIKNFLKSVRKNTGIMIYVLNYLLKIGK